MIHTFACSAYHNKPIIIPTLKFLIGITTLLSAGQYKRQGRVILLFDNPSQTCFTMVHKQIINTETICGN